MFWVDEKRILKKVPNGWYSRHPSNTTNWCISHKELPGLLLEPCGSGILIWHTFGIQVTNNINTQCYCGTLFAPPSRECILACLKQVSSRCTTSVLTGLALSMTYDIQCTEKYSTICHTARTFHSVNSKCLTLQESNECLKILVRWRYQGYGGAAVPAAIQEAEAICRGKPYESVSTECL